MTTNSGHEPIEPTAENEGAEWHCTECDQPCSSGNPCDHCTDSLWGWLDEDEPGHADNLLP